MNYQAIICIYFPHQLLPALVALLHHRRVLQQDIEQPTLIYVRILTDNVQGQHLAQAIKAIVSGIAWIDVEITYAWRLGVLREHHLPVAWRAYCLRRHFPQTTQPTILYAHNVTTDFFAQTIMYAFSKGKRICFGDSLGIVYTPEYFLSKRFQQNNRFKSMIQTYLARIRCRLLLPNDSFNPNEAILILPSDPGGDFLTATPFSIPSQEDCLTVINWLTKDKYFVDDQTLALLNQNQKTIVFFALGNLNESKLTSLQQELALYQAIIDQHVDSDSYIIIKTHPGTNAVSLALFKSQLRHTQPIHFMTEDYSVYPIELCPPLLRRADKILSLSYASISVPYLYAKPVVHVLTGALINEYFSSSSQEWMHESNQHYLTMINALLTWDHQTVLPMTCR